MTQEIQEQHLPIVMKSGLVHWVTEATHLRFQEATNAQKAHSLIRIAELGISINTAEMEGAYTMEQYDDLAKIKQGMWQCLYKKWHKKKGECECQVDFYKQQKRIAEELEDMKNNRIDTPEERAKKQKAWREIGEELKAKGVIKK